MVGGSQWPSMFDLLLMLLCSVNDVVNMMTATSASILLVGSGSVISVILCVVVRVVEVIIALNAELVIGVLRRILQDHILNRLCVKIAETT